MKSIKFKESREFTIKCPVCGNDDCQVEICEVEKDDKKYLLPVIFCGTCKHFHVYKW